MSLQDRDLILRPIRMLMDALRRLMGQKPPVEEVLRKVDDTGQTVFGPLYGTLRDANAAAALALVLDQDRRWALAVLHTERGEAWSRAGKAKEARRAWATAAALLHAIAGPDASEAPGTKGAEADPATGRVPEHVREAIARIVTLTTAERA